MPSSAQGITTPDHWSGARLMNSSMWSPYGLMPWHQTIPAQQMAYPMPFPVLLPQPANCWQNNWCPTMGNFASLPPKPKQDHIENPLVFAKIKPKRRFSDPGPVVGSENLNPKDNSDGKIPSSSIPDVGENAESQPFSDASRDRVFSTLLQELRSARHLNRQLCLELHKVKLQLQLAQQQTNDHQNPGSIAALVQKLYEAHHIRSDILFNWNKSEDSSGRRSSYSSSRFEQDEHENLLLRQRESLITRLQSIEKKIQHFRNAQWHGGSSGIHFHPPPPESGPTMANSRCTNDVLSSSKVSRRHSFALTSPTTSDPPSLDDVDLGNSKHGLAATGSSGVLPRSLHEGRLCCSIINNNSMATQSVATAGMSTTAQMTSTPSGEAALKRDLELQLANVERDRRQLEHQLVETIGIRHHSEDRIIKLERLVSVLRKKLEVQASTSNVGSVSGSIMPPSPTESNGTTTANTTATSPECPTLSCPTFVGRSNQMVADGPSSLPSYLQIVGPITKL